MNPSHHRQVRGCPVPLNVAETPSNKSGPTDLPEPSNKECIVSQVRGRSVPSISQQVFIKHLLGPLALAIWLEQVNYLIPDCVCKINERNDAKLLSFKDFNNNVIG